MSQYNAALCVIIISHHQVSVKGVNDWVGACVGDFQMDYCNAALAGLPQATVAPLQRVQTLGGMVDLRDEHSRACYSLYPTVALASSTLACPIQTLL